jgi:hypothetical protein
MSRYTFIDGYGDEQPMPSHLDTNKAQYQRGFIGGGWQRNRHNPQRGCAETTLDERILHDLKCEAFKRGWEDGKRTMAAQEVVADLGGSDSYSDLRMPQEGDFTAPCFSMGVPF